MEVAELQEKVRAQYAKNVFPGVEEGHPGAVRLPNDEAVRALCEVIAPMLHEHTRSRGRRVVGA